jgi:hypothetical protein
MMVFPIIDTSSQQRQNIPFFVFQKPFRLSYIPIAKIAIILFM